MTLQDLLVSLRKEVKMVYANMVNCQVNTGAELAEFHMLSQEKFTESG